MEQLPVLASGSKATTTTPFYLALDHKASASSSPPAEAPTPPLPPPAVSDPPGQSNSERGSEIIKAKIMSHPLYPALLRAFIDCRKVCTNFQRMSTSIADLVEFLCAHLLYFCNFHEKNALHSLLLEIGAPPEVVGRLSALAGEVEMNSGDVQEQPADPELDQFMVTTWCLYYLPGVLQQL